MKMRDNGHIQNKSYLGGVGGEPGRAEAGTGLVDSAEGASQVLVAV